jgi:hypothetical protein
MADENNPPTGAKRKRTSMALQYFRDSEDGKRVCTVCENEPDIELPQVYKKTTATTNLRNHLIDKHGILGLRNEMLSDAKPGHLSSAQKAVIDGNLVKFVVARKEAFAIAEDSRFIEYTQSLNPQYTIPCRKTLENKIMIEYNKYEEKVMQLIEGIRGKVSLTCDGWSSRKRKGYFVITVHWLTENWKLSSAILEFVNFPPPHDTNSTVSLMLNVLQKYKIEKKVFAVTTDNASEMVSSMKELKRLLNLQYNSDITYEWHLRCICHVLNLGVQDAMKMLSSTVEKLRQLLKCVRTSPALSLKFKDIQISRGNERVYEVTSLDVPNRWNSSYLMISKCYKLRDVFDSVCLSVPIGDSLIDMMLSSKEWEDMNDVADFLEIAFKSTEAASGSKYLTISLQPIIFNILINHCEQAISGIDLIEETETVPEIVSGAEKLKKKLMKYKKNLLGFLPSVALALDPRMGSTYTTTEEIKEELRKIMKEKYGLQEVDHLSQQQELPESQSTSTSIFQRARSLAGLATSNPKSTNDELDDFYEFTKNPEDERTDPLMWWHTIGRSRFPTISKMARDVLCCMASSVPSESAFSQSSGYVTPLRSKMNDEIFEAQMKLQSWYRLFENLDA